MKVNVYKLSSIPFIKAFPSLLATVINKGHRVLVQCDGEEEMQFRDNLLWSYSSLSFLPHGTEKDNFAELQPIYLTCNYRNNINNADILFANTTTIDFQTAQYKTLLCMYYIEQESYLVEKMLKALKANMFTPTIFVENKGLWKIAN